MCELVPADQFFFMPFCMKKRHSWQSAAKGGEAWGNVVFFPSAARSFKALQFVTVSLLKIKDGKAGDD